MFVVVRRLCRACLNVGCFGSAINKKCLRVETVVACRNHHLRRGIIKTCRCFLKLSPDRMYYFKVGVPDCRPPGCRPAVVRAADARPPLARLPPARVPACRSPACRPALFRPAAAQMPRCRLPRCRPAAARPLSPPIPPMLRSLPNYE